MEAELERFINRSQDLEGKLHECEVRLAEQSETIDAQNLLITKLQGKLVREVEKRRSANAEAQLRGQVLARMDSTAQQLSADVARLSLEN